MPQSFSLTTTFLPLTRQRKKLTLQFLSRTPQSFPRAIQSKTLTTTFFPLTRQRKKLTVRFLPRACQSFPRAIQSKTLTTQFLKLTAQFLSSRPASEKMVAQFIKLSRTSVPLTTTFFPAKPE